MINIQNFYHEWVIQFAMKNNSKFSGYCGWVILFLLTGLRIGFGFGQKLTLPIIRAHSKIVTVRDGNVFKKGAWTISPEIRPDVYSTFCDSGIKQITFYTDIDSLSIRLSKWQSFNFIILCQKDSAYTSIKCVESYMGSLKAGGNYDTVQNTKLKLNSIHFTYQSADTPELVQLKKKYNLDSVAGGGNEVSKVLNLLHWVHNKITHDGNKRNPGKIYNALGYIEECTYNNKTLNCRGLATVLNECYLSMGFASRFITCLPKDTSDFDCHVINMVYLKSLNKWIWIDPTNDAYVMDEKGNLLGIEEVRFRLINNQPLILNPDANWNRKQSTTIEDYLYTYMTKNLFRFCCPLDSKYNCEEIKEGKKIEYIYLLPNNDDFDYRANNSENRHYNFTRNEKIFFGKP